MRLAKVERCLFVPWKTDKHMAIFSYHEAFARNLGLVTPEEQEILRRSRVAIPGLGGVGGIHLITLARLGIGKFHIADLDTYDLVNFNRQFGATMETLGRPKAQTMEEILKSINPEADVTIFPEGVNADSMDDFLKDVDVVVDSIDAFAPQARSLLFNACERYGVPIVTAGPIGMGTAWITFMPGSMRFEDYFGLKGRTEIEQVLFFVLGLAGTGYHLKSLVDPSYLNLSAKKGPSTAIGCTLAAGVAGTEVLKLLLKRGNVRAAPWYHHFDAYTGRWKRGYLWRGAKNPVMQLKRSLALAKLRKKEREEAETLLKDP